MKSFSPNSYYSAAVLRNAGIWNYVIRTSLILSVIFWVMSGGGGLNLGTISFLLITALMLVPPFYLVSFYTAAGKPPIFFNDNETFVLKDETYPLSNLNLIRVKDLSVGSPNRLQPFYNSLFLELGVFGKKASRIHINFMSEKFIPDFKMLNNVVDVLLLAKSRDAQLANDVDAVLAVLNHLRIERESLQNEKAIIRRFNHVFSPPNHVKDHDTVTRFKSYIAYINRD